MTTYDSIWKHIIDSNNIDVNSPLSLLTSENIKKCKNTWKYKQNQFEPRLLCKMDNSNSRPMIFKDNNLSILSIKNGTYALIKNNIYHPLTPYYGPPMIIHKNSSCELLKIGQSETSMLDNLQYSNVLEYVIGEKINWGPLLGGRHRCTFNTIVDSQNLHIQGSQYETDGCYETDNYVCIVEAKSIHCHDFNIRQLYYPFRAIYGNTSKKIIALFIFKDKQNIIHIYKYKWNDFEKMLDIEKIGYYQYYFIDN